MKTIGIDMDDTLCDFRTPYLRGVAEGIKYPQSEYGFFKDLQPIKGAISAFFRLNRHFKVHIVTRPSIENPFCYVEKPEWIKYWLGKEFLPMLTITSSKHLFDLDYLIDDKIWEGFKGEQIVFDRDLPHAWANTVNYILEKENINANTR